MSGTTRLMAQNEDLDRVMQPLMKGDTAAFTALLAPSIRQSKMKAGITNYLMYFHDVCGAVTDYRIIGRGLEGEEIIQYELDVNCTGLDTVAPMKMTFVKGSWYDWEPVGLQLEVPAYFHVPFVDSMGRQLLHDFQKKNFEEIYAYSADVVTDKQDLQQQQKALKEGRKRGKLKKVRYLAHETVFRGAQTMLIVTYFARIKRKTYYVYISFYLEDQQYLFGHLGFIPLDDRQ